VPAVAEVVDATVLQMVLAEQEAEEPELIALAVVAQMQQPTPVVAVAVVKIPEMAVLEVQE
jgi:hypothetical protein